MKTPIKKLVSGAQTGADRAALDFALAHGVPCGGWVPRGRKAEDGPVPDQYPVTETTSGDYLRRTELNVKDSDATVIFTIRAALTGGSKRTAEFAVRHGKPFLHLSRSTAAPANELARFLREHRVAVLNVAGSRASKEPAVGAFVGEVLTGAFGDAVCVAAQSSRRRGK